MSNLSWQAGLCLIFAGFVALSVVVCAIDANRKTRRRRLLKQLNSPFFRNVYDPHFRAGKLN